METLETEILNPIIIQAVAKGMSYENYRALVANLATINGTTGNVQTEEMVQYTKLNNKRMNRWDKTIKISDEVQKLIVNFQKKVTWLVITESWCGDAAHIVPAINKVATLSSNIDLKIVLRDANDALMQHFLTNGSKAVPKLIMLDNETLEVLGTFGPRPSEAANLVTNYKAKHGALTPEFKEDLQRWYNNDKGESTIIDLLALLD